MAKVSGGRGLGTLARASYSTTGEGASCSTSGGCLDFARTDLDFARSARLSDQRELASEPHTLVGRERLLGVVGDEHHDVSGEGRAEVGHE